MKNTFKNIFAALLAAAVAGCVPEAEPIVNQAPEINYPMTDETIMATVGEPVDFEVEIVAGDRLNCGWYVDGVMEATTASFTYVFDEPGDYEVRFEARNGSGSSSKTYKVTASDKLEIYLSCADMLQIEDGTTIERIQDDFLKVNAVVVSGADVKHSWTVTDAEGAELCTYDKAYFDTFQLTEIATYTVVYSGSNSVGSYDLTFNVKVNDKPLNVEFSVPAGTASATEGQEFTIDAAVISGADGLDHSWSVDGEKVSQDEDFKYTFDAAGQYTVSYNGINAKNETFSAEWTVNVASSATLLDDFEGDLKPWWKTGTKVTFDGEGDKRKGEPAQDVQFIIKVQPHPVFRRENDDLICEETITLRDALCGYTFNKKGINGQNIHLEFNDVIQPNTEKRIPGYGSACDK